LPFPFLHTDNAAGRLAGLLDSAMDAIITADEAQNIILYNRAAERIFGWPFSQVIGRPLTMLLPERFRAGHDRYVKCFGLTGITSRRMGGHNEVRGLRANGEEFPVDASISQLDTPEGRLFTVILRDVSERAKANEELSALAVEAGSIREQEKARIARELHDELAQSLTALKMDTNWLRDELRESGETRPTISAKLQAMQSMLDNVIAATRRISSDLRPLLLDDLGLVPAIEWLAQNFRDRTGVDCVLSLDESVHLGEPHATAAFRIVQESLANVAKHAQASEVSVSVARERGRVVLRVCDDGVGFDPTAPRKPNSLGLAGLRERSRLLKGDVLVDSEPGRGTRIEIRIPVPGGDGSA
jgi:PAS domain S-box-containing protein